MSKKNINLIDDYNGKFDKLIRSFPEVAKKILKSDDLDRFMSGINSVTRIRSNGKEFLFIETPGHGWILDMSGKIVGEEDGGFFDKKRNGDFRSEEITSTEERLF